MPFMAAVTAVRCSAALPTMGSKIVPMKALGRWYFLDTSSMESTRHSEQAATTRVVTASISVEVVRESWSSGSALAAPFSSASSRAPSCSSWKRSACVFSWKTKKAKYTMERKIEQIRESNNTSDSDVPWMMPNIVGRQMLIEATTWQVMLAAAPCGLKTASCLFMPEAKIAMPRTRSKLERIDPNKLPCTTLIRPARTAWTHMIISTALPNVAFKSPPTICPVCVAIASVAAPRMLANGIMARKLVKKTTALLHSLYFE
mmetsp:Transcript_20572/g.56172  ORF Transcript_20572/g.56172 Transcript_20572/m.56172 type:complete len:260 (+) Transcript_20572:442-1221(+)